MKKYKINDKVGFMYNHRKSYGHGYIKRISKGLFGAVYWVVQVKTLDMHKVRENDIIGVLEPNVTTTNKKRTK